MRVCSRQFLIAQKIKKQIVCNFPNYVKNYQKIHDNFPLLKESKRNGANSFNNYAKNKRMCSRQFLIAQKIKNQ